MKKYTYRSKFNTRLEMLLYQYTGACLIFATLPNALCGEIAFNEIKQKYSNACLLNAQVDIELVDQP